MDFSKPPPWRRALILALGLVPVSLLGVMGYERRWMSDDGFINVRIVQNILAGNGPVFNAAERVEAYTNPLWVGLLSIWGGLGGPLEVGAVAAGLALALAGLAIVQLASSRLQAAVWDRPGRTAGLPAGALVFAAIPVVWDFATSGLETGLIFFWLGGVFYLLVDLGIHARRAGPSAARTPGKGEWPWYAGMVFLGLGPLVRPDLGLFSVILGAILLMVRAQALGRAFPGLDWLRLAAVGALAPVSYQVFRMGYFAALTPNTAIAKEAGTANWAQGWAYLSDLVLTYHLWVPVGILLVCLIALGGHAWRAGDRAQALVAAGMPVAAVLHLGFVVYTGGDFMHGRLLLPGLFGLLAPMATVTIPEKTRPWAWAAGAAVLGWVCLSALSFRVPYAGQIGPRGIADERGFYVRTAGHPNPITVRDYENHFMARQGQVLATFRERVLADQGDRAPAWLRRGAVLIDFGDDPNTGMLAPDRQIAVPLGDRVPRSVDLVAGRWSIGLSACAAGLAVHVVDRRGVADPLGARLKVRKRGRPGHDKELPNAWILARFADPSGLGRPPRDVEAAGAVLARDEFRALLDAIEEPLTTRLFFRNVRDAWAFQRLRFPADPMEAVSIHPPKGG